MISIIDLLAHKGKRAFIFACRSLFVAIKLFTLQYSQMHSSNSKVFNTVLKTQDFVLPKMTEIDSSTNHILYSHYINL